MIMAKIHTVRILIQRRMLPTRLVTASQYESVAIRQVLKMQYSTFDGELQGPSVHLTISCTMHLIPASSVILAFVSLAQAAARQPRDLLQDLQNQAIANLKEVELNSNAAKRSCSVFNASARRDW